MVSLDCKGKAIWLAEYLYLILVEFSKILYSIKFDEKAKFYVKKYEELKFAFTRYAWDGEWFFRATKDNGGKIKSMENE